MELVGIMNINVQKKFLNLWYKKNKFTLQDISLTKKKGTKMELEGFIVGELIIILMTHQMKIPMLSHKNIL